MLSRVVRALRTPFSDVLITDARLMEQALGRARAFLALLSLAVVIGGGEAGPGRGPASLLLGVYTAHSIAIILLLRSERAWSWRLYTAIHGVDLAVAWLVSSLTAEGPFFLLFLFVLMASAYRWGSAGTLLTTGLALALLACSATFGPLWLGDWTAALDTSELLVRAMYVGALGYLCGYLADAERRLEREAAALARVMMKVRSELGLRDSVEAIMSEVLELFAAPRALLAIRETHSGDAFLWSASAAAAPGQRLRLDVHPIDTESWSIHSFSAGSDSFRIRRRQGGVEVMGIDGAGRKTAPAQPLPERLVSEHDFERSIAVDVSLGDEGEGRLYLLDPRRDREGDLLLLRRLTRQLEPVVQNVFLMRRLRARAGAAERARVARELHDGVIQSLIGLEMQVDVLRRQAIERTSAHAGALTHIQALLRHEIITVRELMEQMKPVDVGPAELIDQLAQVVDRFSRETGISARMVTDLEDVTLPPRVCSELTRIVQEALINVRRHSGARNVLVRFGRDGSHWVLSIDDDGRGFGFSGRLNQQELDQRRKGPMVIKERVRSAGGELLIESRPDQGSRLEIRLPEELHA